MKAAKRAERNGPPLSVMIVTGLIWPVVGSVSSSTRTCQRVVRFGQGELDRGDRVVLVGGG
jgi:hypothetical protein